MCVNGGLSLDFLAIQSDVNRFLEYLKGDLSTELLRAIQSFDSGAAALAATLEQIEEGFPGVNRWLELKAALSSDLIQSWKDIVQ